MLSARLESNRGEESNTLAIFRIQKENRHQIEKTSGATCSLSSADSEYVIYILPARTVEEVLMRKVIKCKKKKYVKKKANYTVAFYQLFL